MNISYFWAGQTPVTSYFWYLYKKQTSTDLGTNLVFGEYYRLNDKWAVINELLTAMGQNPFLPLQAEILKNCYLFAKKMGW